MNSWPVLIAMTIVFVAVAIELVGLFTAKRT
jgi:thiol:disulfide interchange protein